jgi:hypothetical protein
MSGDVNYKMKYQELKLNFKKSVDLAFRLGFGEGSKQATQQATQQKAQEQEASAQQPGQPGQPGGDPSQESGASQPGDDHSAPMPGGAAPGQPANPQVEAQPMAESEHPDGTELDQHISTLENMLSKSELDPEELQKYVKDLKQEIELKKSAEAIKGIAKALHKPQFNIGNQANHNMSSNAKTAVTLQHKIVADVMKKWEQEEKQVSKDIMATLNKEGITKK